MTAPVLCIGGMDSSGGAGLLRDAATAAELGAPCRVAVTAVTAQSDSRVAAVLPMPAGMLATQIALAVETGIAAAKTGMLVSRDLVETVANAVPQVPLVVDPVLRATSGRTLLDRPGVLALLALLLPRATVLTPNLPELAELAAHVGLASAPEPQVVEALLDRGCAAVLVKGGHGNGTVSEDRLYRPGQAIRRFRAPRLHATLRGTGCRLASAITVGLAAGLSLETAIAAAKTLLTRQFEEAARRKAFAPEA